MVWYWIGVVCFGLVAEALMIHLDKKVRIASLVFALALSLIWPISCIVVAIFAISQGQIEKATGRLKRTGDDLRRLSALRGYDRRHLNQVVVDTTQTRCEHCGQEAGYVLVSLSEEGFSRFCRSCLLESFDVESAEAQA